MPRGDRFEQNFLSDIVGISLNQIIHIAEIFSVSEEYVKQCFDAWLFMNTYDLPFKVYLKDNPSTLWRAASALSDEWK